MLSPSEAKKNIIVIGGVLVDDIAIPVGNLLTGSSNPVTWDQKLGGVAANVACVVAQQFPTQFIGSVGADSHGHSLDQLLQQQTIQTTMIVVDDQSSDRYTAVLDANGELHIGLASVRLAERLAWNDIQVYMPTHAPVCVVLDANLTKTCLSEATATLVERFGESTLLIGLAVSPSKVLRWRESASMLSVFFCNRLEAAALTNQDPAADIDALADAMMARSIQQFVITDGQNPVLVQQHSDRTLLNVPMCTIKKTVNGAGDAMAGASIAQIVNGFTLANAVESAGLPAAQSILNGSQQPPIL